MVIENLAAPGQRTTSPDCSKSARALKDQKQVRDEANAVPSST